MGGAWVKVKSIAVRRSRPDYTIAVVQIRATPRQVAESQLHIRQRGIIRSLGDRSAVNTSRAPVRQVRSQKTTRPEYFWPRPSADDFATVASGASNLAWTSDKLQKSVTDLTQAFHQANPGSGNAAVPEEMVTASASGLDPEISLAAARLQEARVASARHLTPAQTDRLASLVNGYASTESFAPSRVNVLVLNVAVDAEFANGKGH